MLVEKETKEANSKFFAVTDINARAAAAYAANKQLFTSTQHTTKVELVDSILKSIFVGYATAYQTSRAATSKRGVQHGLGAHPNHGGGVSLIRVGRRLGECREQEPGHEPPSHLQLSDGPGALDDCDAVLLLGHAALQRHAKHHVPPCQFGQPRS